MNCAVTLLLLIAVAIIPLSCGLEQGSEQSVEQGRQREQEAEQAATEATAQVEEENRPPVAHAGDDQLLMLSSEVVTLDATGSVDPDGDVLLYSWKQTVGESVSIIDVSPHLPTASFDKPTVPQALEFQLTVSDPSGETATDTVLIVLENAAPIAHAGWNSLAGRGVRFMLDASASSDPEGHTITFRWQQSEGSLVSLDDSASPRPSFLTPQYSERLTFELTVTDEYGTTAIDEVVIDVGNLPPISEAGESRTAPGGQEVTLNGSGSTDPEGEPLSFAWRQIGGESVSLANEDTATPTFPAPIRVQSLRFELTVSDGETDTRDTTAVAVSHEPILVDDGAGSFVSADRKLLYKAIQTASAGTVETSARLLGERDTLIVDVLCSARRTRLLAFQVLDVPQWELDKSEGDRIKIRWLVSGYEIYEGNWTLLYVNNNPTAFLAEDQSSEFDMLWQRIHSGGRLTVQIEEFGLWEDVFDLDVLAVSPILGNLVNCGKY